MADENHSRMLLQGVDTWNSWKRARPRIRADLSGALLDLTDLKGSFLYGADLRGATFRRANLYGVDLRRADLRWADLSGANLCEANLIEATLDGATLTDAWLWETQRAGWSIQGIICEAAYWDKDRKERTLYSPGEFERVAPHLTVVTSTSAQ